MTQQEFFKKTEAMLSDEHLVKTNSGWIKTKDLKVGDEIYNIKGRIARIARIEKCGKRPDASIVGEIMI